MEIFETGLGPLCLILNTKNYFSAVFSILYIQNLSAPTICQTFALMLFVQVQFCRGKTDTQSNVIASNKQSIIAVDLLGLCGSNLPTSFGGGVLSLVIY